MATQRRPVASYTTTKGQKVVKYNDGTKTYDGLGQATPQKNTSSAVTEPTAPTTNPSGATPSPLFKEMSSLLGQGKTVTQSQINTARSSGSTIASVQAAPTKGAPSSGGTNPTQKRSNATGVTQGNNYYSRYGKSSDPVLEQPKYEDYQKQLMRDAQRQINELNKNTKSLLADQQVVNNENLAQTRSVNVLSGLAGSSEANVATQKTMEQNKQANKKIENEQNLAVQELLAGVRKDAMDMFEKAKTNYREDMRLAFEQDEQTRQRVNENVSMLAKSGATAEGYAQTDPDTYQKMAQALGGEDVLKAMFTLNRPQEQILDKKVEGGKYVIAYQNPLDGKVRVETLDLGLPAQYTKTVDAGDRILAIPDNWDGDPSKLITVNKGLTPGQAQKGGGGGGGGGAYGSDLDAIIGATEATITSKFGQETFRKQMSKARNDGDKINLVASVVLGKADSQTKTDFANQAVGINQIDKAIRLLDQGVKTGFMENATQYTFNVFGKDFDPKLAEINQLITSAIQPYRNSVTGAAWGDQEDGEYQMLFGSTKYAPSELKQRLEGVKEILASKSATALNAYVNPMNFYDNPFDKGGTGNSARAKAEAAGYDYDAMIADGLSDQEILNAL